MNDYKICSENIKKVVIVYANKFSTHYTNKSIKKREKFLNHLKNIKQKFKDKMSDKKLSIQNSPELNVSNNQTHDKSIDNKIIQEEDKDTHQHIKTRRESFKKLKLYYKLKKSQIGTMKNNLMQSLHNKYDTFHELKTYKKEMKNLARKGLLIGFGLSSLIYLKLKLSNRTQIGYIKFFFLSGLLFISTNILFQAWLNYNFKEKLIQLIKYNS
jgi:hypothetical protein